MREFGPIRKDLGTDNEAAAPYVGLARTLLGQLKTRMASGGLDQLQRTHRLPDGTVIRVASRFGQDEVRIETAPTSNPENIPSSVELPEPEETTFAPEEPEYPEPQSNPYMWVGARIRWEEYGGAGNGIINSIEAGAMTMVVLEPGDNGLVMPDWQVFYTTLKQVPQGSTTPIDLAAMQTNFNNNYPESPAAMHNFELHTFVNTNRTSVMFTKHGLRLYDYWMQQDGPIDGDFSPYDPLHPDGQPRQGVESYLLAGISPDSNTGHYQAWASTHKWDAVAVLDPEEDKHVPPYDNRPQTTWARNLLKSSGVQFGPSSVLPGEYVVKLMNVATPGPFSTRRLQPPKFLNPRTFTYTDAADAQEFRTLQYKPLKVEIEVRLNKAPGTKTQTFLLEIDDWVGGNALRAVQPFGSIDPYAQCNFNSGTNPHAANWWQGALLIDVQHGTVRKVDNYPTKMCVPASYNIQTLWRDRYPLDIYIDARAGSSFPPGYPPTIPYAYGYWIAKVLDNQCCGYYYDAAEMRYPSVDAIAAIAPTGATAIWYFDPINLTFTDVTAEAIAGGGAGGVGWWNYLRDKSLLKCHRPVWMDLFNTSGTFKTGESTPVSTGQACCQDVYFGNG